MQRRDLFRAAAALIGMAALPKTVPAVPAWQSFEPTKSDFMALNNGSGFDTYWLGADGFYKLESGTASLVALDSNHKFGAFS